MTDRSPNAGKTEGAASQFGSASYLKPPKPGAPWKDYGLLCDRLLG